MPQINVSVGTRPNSHLRTPLELCFGPIKPADGTISTPPWSYL